MRLPWRKPEVLTGERSGTFSFSDYLNLLGTFSFNGNTYTLPVHQTQPGKKQEPIPNDFEGYAEWALKRNAIVFALIDRRAKLLSEARFTFRNKTTKELFGATSLATLERPWPNGTTGEFLTHAEITVSLAGNAYWRRVGSRLYKLRPDWVSILLMSDADPEDPAFGLDCDVAGYLWHPPRKKPIALPITEVAHWSPIPDPTACYRGMSWLTPVIREIQGDSAATDHKLKFFENGATPNMVVKLPESVMTKTQFDEIVEAMEGSHAGVRNAYKTLYLAAGADATVVGSDMKQLDFKNTQGAGETRLAAAAGVPAVIAGISEGLAGSSLNAGNYGQARRQFADLYFRPQIRSLCAALARMVTVPHGSELWFDTTDIAFLREDETDAAQIIATQAQAMRTLTDGGFEPQSVINAVTAGDLTQLSHTGLLPVQVQPPGENPAPDAPDDTEEDDDDSPA